MADREKTQKGARPRESYFVGQDLNWDAPWIDVKLRVELPFWLMVDNTTIDIEVGGHKFPVSLHGEVFELHIGLISNSKQSVIYHGPIRKLEELGADLQTFL